jgi:hypothetical protein
MSGDYLCNLVVPGAAKSGTSALHALLDLHPQIAMSREKEPHHFSMASRFAEGAAAHNRLFDHAGETVFGESSTSYMPWPPAIERLADCLDSPRIIMVLRDPVERTFSHYRWRVTLGLERRSFADAVRESGYGFDPDKPRQWGHESYLQFSKYSVYAPLWLETFGRERVLLLDSADLKANARQTLDACFSFLGVAPFAVDADPSANETADLVVRPGRKLRLAARLVPGWLKGGLYRTMKRRMLEKATPQAPAAMTAEERAMVEAELAPDTAYFNALFRA